jgi:glycosyltransferase involved in cell wall biosynthesis
MKTVVLICAYNEEKTILQVLSETFKHVDDVIIVDDGSRDATTSILQSMKSPKGKNLHKLFFAFNKGKGAAIRRGFTYFIEDMKSDFLVTLDADLQHDPKEIKNITSLLKNKVADVVIGSRYMKTKDKPQLKIFLNILANINLFLASGAFFSDVSSGYRSYTREAIGKILPMLSFNSFGIELEILKACMDNDLRVGVIPVECDYTVGKKTNLMRLFKGHWQFAWKYKRNMIKKLFGV